MIEIISEDQETNTTIGRDDNGCFYWRTLSGNDKWHAYPTEAPEEPHTIDLQHLPLEYAAMIVNDNYFDRRRWKKIGDTIPPG